MIFVILLGFLLAVKAVKVTVEVEGRFYCSTNQQAVSVHIELWDYDLIGSDDLLAFTCVKQQTLYQLKGTEDEWWFAIDPYLVIMHTCNGHYEKVRVEFGYISENTLIDFGDQDLADSKLKQKMEDKINEKLGRDTSSPYYVVPSMG